MKATCVISIGELIDKISILQIKLERITDPKKLIEIQKELDALLPQARLLENASEWLTEIKRVNTDLWDIEDDIRAKERDKKFDQTFIDLARSVYQFNDERFKIKDNINKHYGSEIKEQKSYEKYD